MTLLALGEGRPALTVVVGMYAMRPAEAASWSAGVALGSGVAVEPLTSVIPPSAIFILHEPPDRQASLSTYSTSSHEYASVLPPPAMPPSHLPVPSPAWASRATCLSGPPMGAETT